MTKIGLLHDLKIKLTITHPKESAEDIVRLRELHVEMDRAAAAYAKDEGGRMKIG